MHGVEQTTGREGLWVPQFEKEEQPTQQVEANSTHSANPKKTNMESNRKEAKGEPQQVVFVYDGITKEVF